MHLGNILASDRFNAIALEGFRVSTISDNMRRPFTSMKKYPEILWLRPALDFSDRYEPTECVHRTVGQGHPRLLARADTAGDTAATCRRQVLRQLLPI